MTYQDISDLANSNDLKKRMEACAADEGETNNPWGWVSTNIWVLVTTPGWEEAWAYAVLQGKEDIGRDPLVISDPMILSAIQPLLQSQQT